VLLEQIWIGRAADRLQAMVTISSQPFPSLCMLRNITCMDKTLRPIALLQLDIIDLGGNIAKEAWDLRL